MHMFNLLIKHFTHNTIIGGDFGDNKKAYI